MFNRIVALKDTFSKQSTPPPEPKAKPKPMPSPPTAPRDPASALSEDERVDYESLVARSVGEEEAAVLASEDDLRALFDRMIAVGASERDAAVLLVHDLRPALDGRDVPDSKASPEALADVLRLVGQQTLTRTAAGEVIAALVTEGGDAEAVVQARGLAAVRDDDALAPEVEAVLAEHPDEVERFRAGEQRLVGFFTGQVMRRVPGADAKAVQALLRDRLGS